MNREIEILLDRYEWSDDEELRKTIRNAFLAIAERPSDRRRDDAQLALTMMAESNAVRSENQAETEQATPSPNPGNLVDCLSSENGHKKEPEQTPQPVPPESPSVGEIVEALNRRGLQESKPSPYFPKLSNNPVYENDPTCFPDFPRYDKGQDLPRPSTRSLLMDYFWEAMRNPGGSVAEYRLRNVYREELADWLSKLVDFCRKHNRQIDLANLVCRLEKEIFLERNTVRPWESYSLELQALNSDARLFFCNGIFGGDSGLVP